MSEGQRRLSAIMITDMVGYTALAQTDESKALHLLDRYRQLLRPIISEHGGREVKTLGDGLLVEFSSAFEAAQCAIEMQRALRDRNQTSKGEEIMARIGIHIGDVIHREGDVYGDAVNIASRIEPFAEPGGICVSEQVFEQVRNKISALMAKLPPQRLKNVQIPYDIYRVILPWQETQTIPSQSDKGLATPLFANVRRISSGVQGLDKEIGGGLPEGTTTMVYGSPKTGKSVFAFHFLLEAVRTDEPCLFVTTDYVSEELLRRMSSFGWDIQDALRKGAIRLVDMTSAQLKKNVEVPSGSLMFVSVADPPDLVTQSADFLKFLPQRRAGFRVVLDSLTPLFIYNPPMIVAKFLRQFVLKMKSAGSTGFVVTYVEGSVDPQSELIIKSSVDNLLRLQDGELVVEGMVGAPKTRMAYRITGAGMRVGI